MAKEYRDESSFEESEPLTGEDGQNITAWRAQRAHRLDSIWIWIAHGILLCLSVSFFGLALYISSSTKAATVPFTYSPAQSAIQYEIKQFDLPAIPEGPFVGKGPEVDAMWDYITDSIGDTMVSREEMIQMGLSPDGALEITDPDTGRKGYRVAVEVFHQLHCLNLLRQNNYKAHYAALGGDVAAEKHDLHGHLDHCIDALRQFVMCQGDVNVFAFRFPFGDGDPWPDYTTPHVCRNYDRIRTWAVEHTVRQGKDEPEH